MFATHKRKGLLAFLKNQVEKKKKKQVQGIEQNSKHWDISIPQ